MKAILLTALFLLFSLPAMGQPAELYNGRVSLDLPEGFRPMNQAEILQKYPRSQLPQFAFADGDNLTQTIAISRLRFPPGRLPALAELGIDMHRRIAVQTGVTVRRQGLVQIGSRTWYAIDFTLSAGDSPVENLMRIAVADDHLLMLTASSASQVFAQLENKLHAVIESVTLR